MQAIVTKYHGATNTRGSRISARADPGRISLPWLDSMGVAENHAYVALAFCAKFGWRGRLAVGSISGDSGNVYVFTGQDLRKAARVVDPWGNSYTLKAMSERAKRG